MSIQNGERLVTKQDLADFYNNIRPYMGGLVASKAGFTPIGTIISVMGTTAPANYLACDGTVYNIADYTELANYFYQQFGSKNKFGGNGTTTFGIPDLRGEFLRGTGTNSHTNQGNGSGVGIHQDATQHLRLFASDAKTLAYYGESANNNLKNADSSVGSVTTGHKITSTDYTSSNAIIAYTSKPTNTSVLYCIATKNFYIDPTLDYSTDEKVVGTWIDGKPIYQRTYIGTTQDGARDTTITTVSELNLDTLVCAHGILNAWSGYIEQIPRGYADSTVYADISIKPSGNIDLMLNTYYVNGHTNDYTMTLQYTKTTS